MINILKCIFRYSLLPIWTNLYFYSHISLMTHPHPVQITKVVIIVTTENTTSFSHSSKTHVFQLWRRVWLFVTLNKIVVFYRFLILGLPQIMLPVFIFLSLDGSSMEELTAWLFLRDSDILMEHGNMEQNCMNINLIMDNVWFRLNLFIFCLTILLKFVIEKS